MLAAGCGDVLLRRATGATVMGATVMGATVKLVGELTGVGHVRQNNAASGMLPSQAQPLCAYARWASPHVMQSSAAPLFAPKQFGGLLTHTPPSQYSVELAGGSCLPVGVPP